MHLLGSSATTIKSKYGFSPAFSIKIEWLYTKQRWAVFEKATFIDVYIVYSSYIYIKNLIPFELMN